MYASFIPAFHKIISTGNMLLMGFKYYVMCNSKLPKMYSQYQMGSKNVIFHKNGTIAAG